MTRFTRRRFYFRPWGTPRPLAWLDAGSTAFAWYVAVVAGLVGLIVVGFTSAN